MKFLCYLLVLLTLLLSAVPCCTDEDCCEESTGCPENSTENHSTGTTTNSCSPFMVCGACTGFVFVEGKADLHLVTENSADFQPPYNQPFQDHYYRKIWQPPKIS